MKLHVKVIPNARKTEAAGWGNDPNHGWLLRVRVAAPPVEGKANKVRCAFLADSRFKSSCGRSFGGGSGLADRRTSP